MIRNLRTGEFLIELESMRLIAETANHITKPLLGKFLFIYLIFYVYAQAGSLWFSGLVTLEVV